MSSSTPRILVGLPTEIEEADRSGGPGATKVHEAKDEFQGGVPGSHYTGEIEADSSHPASLITLPPELLLIIIDKVAADDRMILRGVSRFFFDTIPQPIHADLLVIETENWAGSKFFTCGGCLRLRHRDKFATALTSRGGYPEEDFVQGGTAAHTRFCNECGVRDLPGDFRYRVADRWDEDDVYWVRCRECKKISKQERCTSLCEACYEDSESCSDRDEVYTLSFRD